MTELRNAALYGLLLLCAAVSGCRNRNYRPMAEYSGYALGGTYHILCDSAGGALEKEVETTLRNMDRSISLWDSLSLISRFNRSRGGIYVDSHFVSVFTVSKRIHDETGGAFNPAVYPLMKLWGLDKNALGADSLFRRNVPVDSVLQYTRFEDITLGGVKDSLAGRWQFVAKKNPRNALDFNGISGGYAVDVLCAFFDRRGIRNYRVEVGAEVRSKGVGPDGSPWRIGIDRPTGEGETRVIQSILPLADMGVSTSGSYRRYYEKDGKRLAYRIDPATGKPAAHTLLCTSVFAPTAAEADAYATAFMSMGAGRATEFLSKKRHIRAYLISSGFDKDYQTWTSPDLEKLIEEKK